MKKNYREETSSNTECKTLEEILDTPMINNSVYDRLPLLLQKGCNLFPPSSRVKDIFLTASLALLSGCFPNCYFLL